MSLLFNLLSKNFTPKRVKGLQLWLDASDSSTITESSGAVSQWDDKSGKGNNVTQGTGSRQATTNATTQNNKNVIDFDGGDVLTAGTMASLASSTTFVVFQNTNTFPVGGIDVDILYRLEDAVGSEDYALTASNGFINTAAPRLRRDRGGTVSLFIDGAPVTADLNVSQFYIGRANGSANPAFSGEATIGATPSAVFGLVGSIAEFLLYNRSLSVAEITAEEAYLSAKWGITLA